MPSSHIQNTSSPHIFCATSSEQCYDQTRVEMDIKALQLQSIEMGRQKAAAIATKEYNLAMVSHSDISKMKVVNT